MFNQTFYFTRTSYVKYIKLSKKSLNSFNFINFSFGFCPIKKKIIGYVCPSVKNLKPFLCLPSNKNPSHTHA